MQSRIRSLVLLIFAILLLLVGSRKEWNSWLEKWQNRKKAGTQNIKQELQKLEFEQQKLDFDSLSGKLHNPVLYFEVIRLGEVDFQTNSKITIESGNTIENASESF